MVFNVVPTIFELALVSTILGLKGGLAFAGILSFILYISETSFIYGKFVFKHEISYQ